MKPEMQISTERNRLVKVLSHLRTRVEDHLEDLEAENSVVSRFALKVKRAWR